MTMLKGLITAVYLRKSRADDPSEPTEVTLQKHTARLAEFALSTGLVVSRTYREVFSGELLVVRPQMMELLQDVEAGKYQAVLCADIDRLGRGGMRDQGLILDTFKYSDTLIITPERVYDLNNELDEQATEFQTFLSRQEYKIIRKRLQRGKIDSVKSGAYLSRAPLGYRKTKIDKVSTLEIVPEKAEFVKMIFDMYVNQNKGATVIAEELYSMGLVSQCGSPLSQFTILRIISNPAYIGKVRWNRSTSKLALNGSKKRSIRLPEEWIVVDGKHEPIIDENTFLRAQEIRRSRAHPASNSGKDIVNPLAGLLFCRNCGNSMRYLFCLKKYHYILCIRKGCNCSVSFDIIENAVLSHLKKALTEIETKVDQPNDTTMIDAQISALEKELLQLQDQRGRLMTFLERGVYSIEDYQARSAALTENINSANRHLEDCCAERERLLCCSLLAQAAVIRNVLDNYASGNPTTKNLLLKTVIERVEYYRAHGRNQPIELSFKLRFDVSNLLLSSSNTIISPTKNENPTTYAG